MMGNFIQDCLTGKSRPDNIDDYVGQWHESDSGISLYAYLGMDYEEYVAWIQTPTILPSIVLAHKSKIDCKNAAL